VIALASNDDDLKTALRLGAVLAIRKPFDPELLALSIVASQRHARPLESVLSEVVAVGDLAVSLANHTIERQGRRQVLSATEWQLFAFLLGRPGRTVGRDELARGAWGPGFRGRDAQIDLYVYRLRRKVELDPRHPRILETVRHGGYRLSAAPGPMRDSVDDPDPRWSRPDHRIP
jgi:DNA-binding response OmpR family regulator